MEAAKLAAEAPARQAMFRDRDGMETDNDRLAEAYAAGARVLGQQVSEPSLHAADYVAAGRREQRARRRQTLPQLLADEPAPQEEQTRQELRASAMRAKLKAQAAPQEPRRRRSPGLDEAKAGTLGQGAPGRWTSARAGSHGSACCWACAIALLFGAGFMAVDSFLGSAPPAGAQQRASATRRIACKPIASHLGAREGSLDAQPAAEPGKADLAPRPRSRCRAGRRCRSRRRAGPRPKPQPTIQTRASPRPTRRLDRLQTGTRRVPPATPVMLSPSAGRTGPGRLPGRHAAAPARQAP